MRLKVDHKNDALNFRLDEYLTLPSPLKWEMRYDTTQFGHHSWPVARLVPALIYIRACPSEGWG